MYPTRRHKREGNRLDAYSMLSQNGEGRGLHVSTYNYSLGLDAPIAVSAFPLIIENCVITATRLPSTSHILPVEKVRPLRPASVVCSCKNQLRSFPDVQLTGVMKRRLNSRVEHASASQRKRCEKVSGRKAKAPSMMKLPFRQIMSAVSVGRRDTLDNDSPHCSLRTAIALVQFDMVL